MALTINNISADSYAAGLETTKAAGQGKTTITPFSEVLKQQEKQVNKSKKTSSASQTEKTSNGSVASTSGTTGTVSADGKLTTTLDDIFRRASEKYGVPYEFLVAVAKAESDFRTDCVSSAGAKGIMQIMPEEAKELGVDDVFDAEQNIMASAKLLAAHLEKFEGNKTLAAAAYNAGSGRVKQYGGVPPFKETQNYVKKIASYMKEGVKVPDRTVTVTPNKLSGDITKSQAKKTSTDTTDSKVPDSLNAVAATAAEMNQSMVVVGSGDQKVTMTYGAYLKYLELGNLGVG